MNFSPEPIQLLLVEDNPGDIRLTKEALRQADIEMDVHVATDGEAAMAFLRKEGEHAQAPRPDLVLLDLNLPRKDGREVLADVKEDPDLMRIPVVVLTTSEADEDITQVYGLHANAYIIKPVDLDRFMEVLETIERFWFRTVKFPSR